MGPAKDLEDWAGTVRGVFFYPNTHPCLPNPHPRLPNPLPCPPIPLSTRSSASLPPYTIPINTSSLHYPSPLPPLLTTTHYTLSSSIPTTPSLNHNPLTTPQLVAPADIAIYGTLCALSSYSRTAIKAQILENSVFGAYVEQEPYVRELLESYMGNRFKLMLETLERYSVRSTLPLVSLTVLIRRYVQTRHALDLHIGGHLTNITNLIRSRALVQYFQPFASIKLERMSSAFGWTVDELERQVVTLIQAGEIQARVDRQNKVRLRRATRDGWY